MYSPSPEYLQYYSALQTIVASYDIQVAKMIIDKNLYFLSSTEAFGCIAIAMYPLAELVCTPSAINLPTMDGN